MAYALSATSRGSIPWHDSSSITGVNAPCKRKSWVPSSDLHGSEKPASPSPLCRLAWAGQRHPNILKDSRIRRRRFQVLARAEGSESPMGVAGGGLASILLEDVPPSEDQGQVLQAVPPGPGPAGRAFSSESASAGERAVTGGARDFAGANLPLVMEPLLREKTIVLVRHGLSSWNEEGRVQGSSDLSVLSEMGAAQALRCREALRRIPFDVCFASPIERAKSSARLIWADRSEPLVYLDSLREANLLFLEGMKNEDAERQHPELYRAWREEPENFHVHGVYPVRNLWGEARKAWRDILRTEGDHILVVTHKSILRAMLCTALGMEPDRFRAVDLNNGGVCVFSINKRGEPMLRALNMTAHLHTDDVYYEI